MDDRSRHPREPDEVQAHGTGDTSDATTARGLASRLSARISVFADSSEAAERRRIAATMNHEQQQLLLEVFDALEIVVRGLLDIVDKWDFDQTPQAD